MLHMDFRKCRQRLSAVLIAAALTELLLPLPAAAEELPGNELLQIDETMYVNLDYYGVPETVNVVKGFTTTSPMEYEDRGSYSAVLNMSNDEPLEITPEGVRFALAGDGEKFFIQGTLPEQKTQLPWNISVSYKLNGVPVEAEKLAGAAGLVEINVTAVPNENCDPYLKNNMLLSVVIPAGKSVYSVDAPGSQTQSLGEITGAAFTALPGEEKTFTARLGTDSYESVGVIILMMPATLDSFDNISDIRDLKDTWRASGDAMYDSLDALFSTVTDMREEIKGIQDSLASAESARATVAAGRDGVFSATDRALADVNDLSIGVQKLIPYVSTAQTGLSEVNRDLNDLVEVLGGMTDSLHELYRGLNRLEDGSYGASYDISRIDGIAEELQKESSGLKEVLDRLEGHLDDLLSGLEDWDPEILLEDYDEDIASSSEASYAGDLAEAAAEQLAGELSGLQGIIGRLRGFLGGLSEKRETMGRLATASDALAADVRRTLSGVGKTAQGARYTVEDIRRVILAVEDLNDTVNVFYPDMQGLLSESQALLGQTGETLNSSGQALTLAHETLKAAAGDVDDALAGTFRNTLSMLDKSLAMLDDLSGVQSAGGEMHRILSDELDKFEEENRFLEIDPEAEKVSFTSSENPSPDSLQIVMRTEEISKDEEETEILDAETEAGEQGLLSRIASVFRRIWEALKEIFSNT